MEGKRKDCPASSRRHAHRVYRNPCPSGAGKQFRCFTRYGRYGITGILAVILILTLGTVVSGLTKAKTQKAQKISSDNVKIIDWGCETMELNPLLLEEYPEVTSAVKEYYGQLGEKASFVESYDEVRVYTKRGKYRGTYVAFVRYNMKIKDIYTEVPGMGTLYVEEDGKNGCRISTEVEDEDVKSFIREIAGQEDVQSLMNETHVAYQEAVKSDALLQEALIDLKNAYEDSTGS